MPSESSQAYFWTPVWQAKEKRADEDVAMGRSKMFNSVEELIAELHREAGLERETDA